MMRIGIVLAVTPGYSETFFTSKIKGLLAHGHDVIVLAGKKEKGFELCPVKKAPKVYGNSVIQLGMMLWCFITLVPYALSVVRFINLEKKQGTSLSNILKKVYLNAHILKQRLDWLHFGFATQAVERELVAKAIGAKMGVSFRGFDLNVYPLKHPGCYKKLWSHVDKAHSISRYLLDKAHTIGLSKETPFEIITPAVVLQELPKEELIRPNERLQIVTIARLTWIKGLEVAIDAMKELAAKKLDFTYYIIGDGSPKDEERYKYMVHELGLQDHVIFCGKLTHQATLAKLYQCSVYVQPSLNEGFCNAALEAQALGKLVIVSDAGALPENVVHEVTGWLFPVGDSGALAQRIQSVSNLSEAKKTKIIKAAKIRVRDQFNIEQQQEEFVKFYTEPL